jgi:hypothetical protein
MTGATEVPIHTVQMEAVVNYIYFRNEGIYENYSTLPKLLVFLSNRAAIGNG